MKGLYVLALLSLFSIFFLPNSAIGYVATEQDLELVQSMLDLKISQCYLVPDEDTEKVQQCFTDIMQYVNLLCNQYGSLESGKCDRAEQYLADRSNGLNT
jgi:hypothetical protein